MTSVTQIEEALQQIFQEEAAQLARDTGFIQRERNLTGADFAQLLIFGWMQHPESTLGQLAQLAPIRETTISPAGLSQRFTQQAADFLYALLQRVTAEHIQAEAVDVPLLRRFSAVIVEDSTQILLPDDLAFVWQSCGGREGTSHAQVKAHVRFDLLTGELHGPCLTDGRVPDSCSPFKDEPLPGGSLYIADLGYFDLTWLKALRRREPGRKRYFLTRLKRAVVLSTRSKHRIELRGVLPQQVGQVVEMGVLVGAQACIPARLLMVRVPKEVADERREQLEQEAKDKGHEVSEEQWYLAEWTLLITNAPRRLLSPQEMLIVLRVRWQIELLFKRWKSEGKVDEWRSKSSWRILCEVYGKLIGLVIVQWVVVLGSWQDPHRSLLKAARVVCDAAQRLMAALAGEARLQSVLLSLTRQMRTGCRMDTRRAHPNTSQLLLDGLDWNLSYEH